MSYADTLRRARRRVILATLASADPPSSSEILLEPMLDVERVFSDRDQIRTEIAWLAAQGLVESEELGGIMFATLLAGGRAIANGKRVHPDIEKMPDKRRP